MANSYYSRRLMGPIVLITIGVLFLLDQVSDWSFWRTWPILFIVIGAVKIFERFLAPSIGSGTPPPGPSNVTWHGPGDTPGSNVPPGNAPSNPTGTNSPPQS